MLENSPLVSIIVRTKDRPKLLRKALQSISGQTYRPIEVVLINDGGCDLDIEEINGILGDVTLNYIKLQENTGRAHAGNVGIENAKGEYIGFLDDDDEYYSEHVATLLLFLKESDCKIAYTAVELIEKTFNSSEGHFHENRKHVFARSFSYRELLLGNYIPLMSLLIASDFIKAHLFDESFELYEDWDMLIRAGRKTHFSFINKVTAKYNQWSDIQINYNIPPEKLKHATLAIYTKHWSAIPSEALFDIRQDIVTKNELIAKHHERIEHLEERAKQMSMHMNDLKISVREKAQYIEDLGAEIKEKAQYIEDLETEIREKDSRIGSLESTLGERQAYINYIQSGTGWKLLTKYFKVRDTVLPIGTTRRVVAKFIVNFPAFVTTNNIKRSFRYLKDFGLKALLTKVKEKTSPEISVLQPSSGENAFSSESSDAKFRKHTKPVRSGLPFAPPDIKADREKLREHLTNTQQELFNSKGFSENS